MLLSSQRVTLHQQHEDNTNKYHSNWFVPATRRVPYNENLNDQLLTGFSSVT